MTERPMFAIAFSLFLLMDPIGNIPVFLSVLSRVDPKRHRRIIFRELCIALLVILFFMFTGVYLLRILNVKQATISIAGGIVLLIIALKMIFPGKQGHESDGAEAQEPLIVPLAIPLIAGPSVLASVIIYSHQEPPLTLISSICIAWVVSTLILLISPLIKHLLGARGIVACERLMGLLLTLMATQMFLEGITLFLNT